MQVMLENPKKNIPTIVNKYVYLKTKARNSTTFEGYATLLEIE